jgi:hypothetical protein
VSSDSHIGQCKYRMQKDLSNTDKCLCPTKIPILNVNTQIDEIWNWALGRWLVLSSWMELESSRTQEAVLPSLPPLGAQWEDGFRGRSNPSSATALSSTLILNFTDSRILRNELLLFISHQPMLFLLQQPTWAPGQVHWTHLNGRPILFLIQIAPGLGQEYGT